MTAIPESLLRLNFLVGVWKTSGKVYENNVAVAEISGSDSYTFTLDGAFILHHADVIIDSSHVKVTELINGNSNEYIMTSFNNEGIITTMNASLLNNELHIVHKDMRARLHSVTPNSMEASWEKKSGDKWIKWMEMEFRRNGDHMVDKAHGLRTANYKL